MGFFESNLSGLGRWLDGCVVWLGDRARAIGDRRTHARSFGAIRDRVDKARDAARAGAERSLDSARAGWRRRGPADRDRVRSAAVLGGVLLAVVVGGALLRFWTRPGARPLTASELAAIRGVQREQQDRAGDARIAPGLEGWLGTGRP